MGQELQTGAIAAALQSCRKRSLYLLVWRSISLDPAKERGQLVRGRETDTADTSTANHRHTSSVPCPWGFCCYDFLRPLASYVAKTKKKGPGKGCGNVLIQHAWHNICLVIYSITYFHCVRRNIMTCLARPFAMFYHVPSGIFWKSPKRSSVQK